MTGGEIMAGADRDVMSTKPEECVNYLGPFRAEPRNRSGDIRLWNWVEWFLSPTDRRILLDLA